VPKSPPAKEALAVEWWPVDRPIPYEGNPRVISEAAVEKVALSISEYGWRQPIVVDEADVIIAGHTRLRAAQKLGLETVPVHVATGLTQAQVKGLRLMDNRAAEESGWDDSLLVAELDELLALDFDLAYAGFEEDLGELFASGEALGLAGHGADDGDELPAAEAFPVSRPGDLWVCGPHRVLCGNATVAEDVATLLGSETAAMCVTDPPFNVAIGKDSNPKHRQRRGLVNDDLPATDFAQFLERLAQLLAERVAGDVYCFRGASEWPALDGAMRAAGLHHSATIIWVKDAFVLGRSKYHRRYEPIWYGWRASATSSYAAGRDQDDVWEFARPRKSEEHPTMKPVPLVRRAIVNSSGEGDLVFDPFLGSGTTMVACDHTNRACRGIDIDPAYVDVAVRRWQQLSGEHARLHGDGRTFEVVAAERQAERE
jgi:DNA modification methylase